MLIIWDLPFFHSAHHPSINATVELLKQGLFLLLSLDLVLILICFYAYWLYVLFYKIFSGITHLKVEPYDEDQGTGELRYVQVINVVEFKINVSSL